MEDAKRFLKAMREKDKLLCKHQKMTWYQ